MLSCAIDEPALIRGAAHTCDAQSESGPWTPPVQHESYAVAGLLALTLTGSMPNGVMPPAASTAASHASIVANATSAGALCQIAWLSWAPTAAMRASSA